jgi:ABC-type glycerol-3-phosphate transport system permease component
MKELLNKTMMLQLPHGKIAAIFLGISLTMLMLISLLAVSSLQRLSRQNHSMQNMIAECSRSGSAENCPAVAAKLFEEFDAAIMNSVKILLIATLISIILASTLGFFVARAILKIPTERSQGSDSEIVKQELLAMRQKIDNLLRIMHNR